MKLDDVRKKYLAFYEKKGHKVIPSALLVPENDPTTLFTGSGMQPLVPYLLGAKHPQGNRLVNSQKSFRSVDIDDVGDNRHTTFFEMLGNWSLGDYFKKEQLPWVFEFLTKEVGLDPKKIYVTVFIGDKKNNIPRDDEAVGIWKGLFKDAMSLASVDDVKDIEMGSEAEAAEKGMQGGRIFYYDVKKNWWSRSGIPANMPAGEPGGPDSELFYEFDFITHDPKYGKHCHPNCDCGRFLEIGNSVFMEYKKNEDGTFSKLPQKNVDFGGGLERIAMVSRDTADIFKIDVFEDLIKTLEKKSGKSYDDKTYTAAFRVVADHVRSSIFLIGDGVFPSNSERGYFVRRLLRRAVRYCDKLGIKESGIAETVDALLEYYRESYPETYARREDIKTVIGKEEEKFRKTLGEGLKELNKWVAGNAVAANKESVIPGSVAFHLATSFGFPIELTLEEAKERGLSVDTEAFHIEMKKHQDLSRAGSEKKFKGGLADASDMSLRYHTATHLLNAALRQVLGVHVGQKGSNITPERLRFDFSHGEKMTDEQKKRVEDIVNDAITRALPVSWKEMPKDEAEKLGAIHAFGEKYGDIVKVYTVSDADAGAGATGVFSREFCGGPHVTNTRELAGPAGTARFKIQKEEAVSAGVRRIKAVLE